MRVRTDDGREGTAIYEVTGARPSPIPWSKAPCPRLTARERNYRRLCGNVPVAQ